MQQNMVTARPVTADGQTVDMSALGQAQKEMLSELLTRQNEQMSANINAILSQTKEISARQMEAVEKLMQKQAAPDPYAIIEEDAPVASQVTKPAIKASYMPRYRSEEPILHQTEVELEPVVDQKEENVSYDDGTGGKRYSSIALNDYYAEQDDTLVETPTSSDWKG